MYPVCEYNSEHLYLSTSGQRTLTFTPIGLSAGKFGLSSEKQAQSERVHLVCQVYPVHTLAPVSKFSQLKPNLLLPTGIPYNVTPMKLRS